MEIKATTNRIGEDGVGTLVKLGQNEMWVNDNFVLATLIAIITSLDMDTPHIGERIASIAEAIYDELKETNTSGPATGVANGGTTDSGIQGN